MWGLWKWRRINLEALALDSYHMLGRFYSNLENAEINMKGQQDELNDVVANCIDHSPSYNLVVHSVNELFSYDGLPIDFLIFIFIVFIQKKNYSLAFAMAWFAKKSMVFTGFTVGRKEVIHMDRIGTWFVS